MGEGEVTPLAALPAHPETAFKLQATDPPRPKARTGTRLDEHWQASAGDVDYARGRGFDGAALADLIDNFKTYWTVGNGRNKTHADWSRAWQTWVRTEAGRRRPNQGFAERPSAATAAAARFLGRRDRNLE